MVGRTPEYLGKKVEAKEMKLVVIGTIFAPISCWPQRRSHRNVRRAVDLQLRSARVQGDALRLHVPEQQQRLRVRGLYGLLLQPNAPGNVGAFGITFADLLGGLAMLFSRFIPLLAALAVAGSLAGKRRLPPGQAPFAPTRRCSSAS